MAATAGRDPAAIATEVKRRLSARGLSFRHAERRDADGETRERVRSQIAAEPGGWVGQELVELSVHPTVVEGALEPRHVDLRPYALLSGDGPRVLPASLSRVASSSAQWS
jgi:uncharacterized circularly permuted ATP-grasp superfamily protein